MASSKIPIIIGIGAFILLTILVVNAATPDNNNVFSLLADQLKEIVIQLGIIANKTQDITINTNVESPNVTIENIISTPNITVEAIVPPANITLNAELSSKKECNFENRLTRFERPISLRVHDPVSVNNRKCNSVEFFTEFPSNQSWQEIKIKRILAEDVFLPGFASTVFNINIEILNGNETNNQQVVHTINENNIPSTGKEFNFLELNPPFLHDGLNFVQACVTITSATNLPLIGEYGIDFNGPFFVEYQLKPANC